MGQVNRVKIKQRQSKRGEKLKNKYKLISALFVILCFVSCASMQKMTPEQTHLTYRTMFNNVLEQFNEWAVLQPEETKVKLRADVIPLLDEAKTALDLYEKALFLPDDDADARLNFYLEVKTKLINLIAKYGLRVDERKKAGYEYRSGYFIT